MHSPILFQHGGVGKPICIIKNKLSTGDEINFKLMKVICDYAEHALILILLSSAPNTESTSDMLIIPSVKANNNLACLQMFDCPYCLWLTRWRD